MTRLVLGLAGLGTALWAWFRFLAALTAKWSHEQAVTETAARLARSLEDRRIAIEEQRLALDREKFEADMKAKQPPAAPAPMPEDLRARVEAWEDDWAKEAEKSTLLQLYAEYQDWDKVRAKLVPLRIAMAQDEIAAPREEWMS